MSGMAFLEIDNLEKRFGARRCAEGHQPRDRGGRLPGAGRPVRLRQVDPAQHHRRAGDDHRRRDPHQRPRVNELHPSQRDIAMVFQSYALYPNMTVAQNIAFGMEIRGVPKPERDKAVARSRRDAADRPSARPQAEPALRRPAPARRHGPRAGARARRSSCSTSRCPISTPSSASTCAPRSSGCISA